MRGAMNRKQMVVANVQYKKPTQDDTKRQKGLLRYLTYRDGRTGHIQQRGGGERWHDLGLGRTLHDVAQRCEAYKSDHVLAFTLVLNCTPQLMCMVSVRMKRGRKRLCGPGCAALTRIPVQREYYARYLPDARRISDGVDPQEARIEFRPLITGLDHENAQGMADIFKRLPYRISYLASARSLHPRRREAPRIRDCH